MVVVKGVYQGEYVKLLESVDAKQGMEVEVIFHNTAKEPSFVKAMEEEVDRMNRGFPLGGGPYYQKRDELHER